MILAGDIGGTKTLIALFDWKTGRVEPIFQESYPSREYGALEDIVREFVEAYQRTVPSSADAAGDDQKPLEGQAAPETPLVIDAACFGVAGLYEADRL